MQRVGLATKAEVLSKLLRLNEIRRRVMHPLKEHVARADLAKEDKALLGDFRVKCVELRRLSA
jgi:hypothetical protein